jgi:hypothetical protein
MDNRPVKRPQFHRDMVPPHRERITVKSKEDKGFIIS